MELLMGRQKAELAAQQARIDSSRVAAAQLIAEFAELGPATSRPGIEQLLGLDQVRDRLAALSHGLDRVRAVSKPSSRRSGTKPPTASAEAAGAGGPWGTTPVSTRSGTPSNA